MIGTKIGTQVNAITSSILRLELRSLSAVACQGSSQGAQSLEPSRNRANRSTGLR